MPIAVYGIARHADASSTARLIVPSAVRRVSSGDDTRAVAKRWALTIPAVGSFRRQSRPSGPLAVTADSTCSLQSDRNSARLVR